MIAITASTWWRATKEASCIVCQQCRDTVVIISTTVNTCAHTHRHTHAVQLHHVSSSATVCPPPSQWQWFNGSVQWVRKLTSGDTLEVRGALLSFPAPFWQYVNLKVKKKSALRCYLQKKKKKKERAVRFVSQEPAEIWSQLQNTTPFNFGTQKTEPTAVETHLKSQL